MSDMREKMADIIHTGTTEALKDYGISSETISGDPEIYTADLATADAIIAALPDMVKPLEWERLGERYHWECHGNLSGNTSFIKVYAGTGCYNLYADGFRGTGHNFPTLDAAKAAAQAHHTAAILSALGLTK